MARFTSQYSLPAFRGCSRTKPLNRRRPDVVGGHRIPKFRQLLRINLGQHLDAVSLCWIQRDVGVRTALRGRVTLSRGASSFLCRFGTRTTPPFCCGTMMPTPRSLRYVTPTLAIKKTTAVPADFQAMRTSPACAARSDHRAREKNWYAVTIASPAPPIVTKRHAIHAPDPAAEEAQRTLSRP